MKFVVRLLAPCYLLVSSTDPVFRSSLQVPATSLPEGTEQFPVQNADVDMQKIQEDPFMPRMVFGDDQAPKEEPLSNEGLPHRSAFATDDVSNAVQLIQEPTLTG